MGCLPAKTVGNGGSLSTASLCYGVERAGLSSCVCCRGSPNAIDPVLIKSSFYVGLGAKKSKQMLWISMGFVGLGCHFFPVLFEDSSKGHSLADPQDKG